MKHINIPDFASLVNFPYYMSSSSSVNKNNPGNNNGAIEGYRNCVMCGHICSTSVMRKLKKNGNNNKNNNNDENNHRCNNNSPRSSSNNKMMHNNSNNQQRFPVIPTQNKGLCTICDVQVWIIVESNIQIKWCKGCKNFRSWASFGEKGMATKCIRCRERQREKYALQKEEEKRLKQQQQQAATAAAAAAANNNDDIKIEL